MAGQTIPLYTGRTIADLNYLVQRVEALSFHRSQCSWCSPESTPGACDGGEPCQSLATVHDLEEDMAYCSKHFARRDGVR